MKIFSGVPPSKRDGAGDFLLYLSKVKKIKVIWKPTSTGRIFKELIICICGRDIELIGIILASLTRYVKYEIEMRYNLKVTQNLCIFHMQSVGCKYTTKMLNTGKIAGIFLVDNFYFCTKAYNWRQKNPLNACIECLDKLKLELSRECMENQIKKENHNEYIHLNNLLRNNFYGKVFTQNEMQYSMARLFFKNAKIIKTGMISYTLQTSNTKKEKVRKEVESLEMLIKDKHKYIVVIHAHGIGPKGKYAVIEMAKKALSIGFVMPYEINNVEYSPNCYGVECKWNTGLKKLCLSADIILIPSVWSVPIEGSLLKSMMYGRRVIALSNTYDNYKKDFESLDYIDLKSKDLEQGLIRIASNSDRKKELLKELTNKMKEWETNLDEMKK